MNRQSYAHQPAARLRAGDGLPGAERAGRAGDGAAVLRRRASTSPAALITVGAWYLFITQPGPLLVPALNLSVVLEPGPGRAVGRRARLRPDRRRAGGGADRPPSRSPRCAARSASSTSASATGSGEPVLNGLRPARPPRRDAWRSSATPAPASRRSPSLSPRFYEFQGGRLLVDGRDIRTLDLQAYRRQLGVVPQAPFLFSGTVVDNIRYARPAATAGRDRGAGPADRRGRVAGGAARGPGAPRSASAAAACPWASGSWWR